jgi:phosphohistidine phosphatase SixA
LGTPGFLFAGQPVGDTTPKLTGQHVLGALKQGGYVIYFRHGKTENTGEKEVADKDLDNCAMQRNLSAAGQDQTKTIGTALTHPQIPIGEVYSSPYCRCLDSARNMFGKGAKTAALHFVIHVEKAERAVITTTLLDLLAAPPKPGTNTALVAHTANLKEAVNIWPKAEGDAHIFKPEGNGKFSYVGMLAAEEWSR